MKTPRFKKKPRGVGRGQLSVNAMKLAIERGGRGGLVAMSWLGVAGSQARNTIPLYGARGRTCPKSHEVVERHPVGVARELGERSGSTGVVLVA
ncbi:hypothetical protein AVEN_235395-1 [Araneus ventricosus]|uniref:Uncharacterized protein n=1 Tax=Araneus ventricosus TaxID=182803 RepID=A0A4Y2A4I4_ARAVE|nr:hypothetical protein AVEN_235395-1 [Araneus ventricosus]